VLLKHLIEAYPDHEVPGTPAHALYDRLRAEWSTMNAA
jgi:hypothetical protein